MMGKIPGGILLASLVLGTTHQTPAEGMPGKALFLHFTWVKGAITLVEKNEIQAHVKISRGAGRRAAGEGVAVEAGHGCLSYELLSSRDKTLSRMVLPDHDVRRVEYQEPGEAQLRSYSEKVDSTDLFVTVALPQAERIRFYGHCPELNAKSGGNSSGTKKAFIAEFPLAWQPAK